MSALPTDPQERKKLQLYTFMFNYFPDAWLEVVRVARLGNEQHNPGEPLHWARGKSTDQMNAAFNHVFDYGSGVKKDASGSYHLANAIWRLMAQLQLDLEHERHCEKIAAGFPKLTDTAAAINLAADRLAELRQQATSPECQRSEREALYRASQPYRRPG